MKTIAATSLDIRHLRTASRGKQAVPFILPRARAGTGGRQPMRGQGPWSNAIATLRRWYASAQRFLGEYYRLCQMPAGVPAPARHREPKNVTISAGGIARFDSDGSTVTLEILAGTVWLTGSPEMGDAILESGTRLELPPCEYPWIIQALQGGSIARWSLHSQTQRGQGSTPKH